MAKYSIDGSYNIYKINECFGNIDNSSCNIDSDCNSNLCRSMNGNNVCIIIYYCNIIYNFINKKNHFFSLYVCMYIKSY